jgi:hypothetical protein
MFNTIIQILLAIFVILILGFIAYSIYDRDYVKSVRLYNTNKMQTKIFTGVYPFCGDGAIRLETMNRDDPYFVDINPSVNQNGGAEYSYNFWLYFNITDGKRIINRDNANNVLAAADDVNEYIVLFYKGVKQLIPYKQYNYSCDTINKNNTSKATKYILVKNPLVKISNDGKELIVEYNNISAPDTYNSSAVPLVCTDTSILNSLTELSKNKLGIKEIDTNLYNKTYNMITIVMQESPSNEEALFSNRTNCKIYFNGTLIADRSTYNNNIIEDNNINSVISTAMKKNLGSLFINPSANLKEVGIESPFLNRYINKIAKNESTDATRADCPLKMADMSYFNYVLSEGEIKLLYSKGFDEKISDIGVREMGLDKKYFLKGNKIDFNMYNNADDGKMPVLPI